MMAVLLAGGKGTRLKPFTMTIPKPLLPLGDIPIIEVVLCQLAAAGIQRVVITLGHMAPLFMAAVANGVREDLKIEFALEDQPLGTAGPLLGIKDLEEDFLVMNGDILTSLDYGKLISSHQYSGAWGTIAISRRQVLIDYGVVETDASGLFCNYVEKPTIDYAVSMGVNVLSRKALELIPRGRKFDMPELMLAIHKSGNRVVGFKTDCYWQDIGRFDDYQRASEDFVADPDRFLKKGK